jgi:hypothetical protein
MYQLDENDPDGWKKARTDLFDALAGIAAASIVIAWIFGLIACVKFMWYLV